MITSENNVKLKEMIKLQKKCQTPQKGRSICGGGD